MKRLISVIFIIVFLFLVVQISSASLDLERQQRLAYGHVMKIENVGTLPSEISPGAPGKLLITIRNTGDFELSDIRVQVTLPSEIAFLNDISKRKIAVLNQGEAENLEFNIITLPEASEGVYTLSIKVDYLNKIGTERQDNDTFAIVVRSTPEIFVKIDDSDLYKGQEIGDVTITFVNNDVADIKFLTVELKESPDYDIISSSKKYIGDLDSDDFESADFRLRLKTEKEVIPLPLDLNYKDSLNNDYSEELIAELNIRSAKELGVKTNGTALTAFVVLVILVVAFFAYRIYKKKITPLY